MAEEDKDQQVGDQEPIQLYRFKVRTADGREMVSAVAVVDPNSKAEGKDDAKDSAEELDQKHKEEAKDHDEQIDQAHKDEADRHGADLDAHHQAQTDAHTEATDARHEGEQ